MTNKGLRGIAKKKGVNAAMDALISKSMEEYPIALLHEIRQAAARGGMSGGLITDTAEDYIKRLTSK